MSYFFWNHLERQSCLYFSPLWGSGVNFCHCTVYICHFGHFWLFCIIWGFSSLAFILRPAFARALFHPGPSRSAIYRYMVNLHGVSWRNGKKKLVDAAVRQKNKPAPYTEKEINLRLKQFNLLFSIEATFSVAWLTNPNATSQKASKKGQGAQM